MYQNNFQDTSVSSDDESSATDSPWKTTITLNQQLTHALSNFTSNNSAPALQHSEDSQQKVNSYRCITPHFINSSTGSVTTTTVPRKSPVIKYELESTNDIAVTSNQNEIITSQIDTVIPCDTSDAVNSQTHTNYTYVPDLPLLILNANVSSLTFKYSDVPISPLNNSEKNETVEHIKQSEPPRKVLSRKSSYKSCKFCGVSVNKLDKLGLCELCAEDGSDKSDSDWSSEIEEYENNKKRTLPSRRAKTKQSSQEAISTADTIVCKVCGVTLTSSSQSGFCAFCDSEETEEQDSDWDPSDLDTVRKIVPKQHIVTKTKCTPCNVCGVLSKHHQLGVCASCEGKASTLVFQDSDWIIEDTHQPTPKQIHHKVTPPSKLKKLLTHPVQNTDRPSHHINIPIKNVVEINAESNRMSNRSEMMQTRCVSLTKPIINQQHPQFVSQLQPQCTKSQSILANSGSYVFKPQHSSSLEKKPDMITALLPEPSHHETISLPNEIPIEMLAVMQQQSVMSVPHSDKLETVLPCEIPLLSGCSSNDCVSSDVLESTSNDIEILDIIPVRQKCNLKTKTSEICKNTSSDNCADIPYNKRNIINKSSTNLEQITVMPVNLDSSRIVNTSNRKNTDSLCASTNANETVNTNVGNTLLQDPNVGSTSTRQNIPFALVQQQNVNTDLSKNTQCQLSTEHETSLANIISASDNIIIMHSKVVHNSDCSETSISKDIPITDTIPYLPNPNENVPSQVSYFMNSIYIVKPIPEIIKTTNKQDNSSCIESVSSTIIQQRNGDKITSSIVGSVSDTAKEDTNQQTPTRICHKASPPKKLRKLLPRPVQSTDLPSHQIITPIKKVRDNSTDEIVVITKSSLMDVDSSSKEITSSNISHSVKNNNLQDSEDIEVIDNSSATFKGINNLSSETPKILMSTAQSKHEYNIAGTKTLDLRSFRIARGTQKNKLIDTSNSNTKGTDKSNNTGKSNTSQQLRSLIAIRFPNSSSNIHATPSTLLKDSEIRFKDNSRKSVISVNADVSEVSCHPATINIPIQHETSVNDTTVNTEINSDSASEYLNENIPIRIGHTQTFENSQINSKALNYYIQTAMHKLSSDIENTVELLDNSCVLQSANKNETIQSNSLFSSLTTCDIQETIDQEPVNVMLSEYPVQFECSDKKSTVESECAARQSIVLPESSDKQSNCCSACLSEISASSCSKLCTMCEETSVLQDIGNNPVSDDDSRGNSGGDYDDCIEEDSKYHQMESHANKMELKLDKESESSEGTFHVISPVEFQTTKSPQTNSKSIIKEATSIPKSSSTETVTKEIPEAIESSNLTETTKFATTNSAFVIGTTRSTVENSLCNDNLSVASITEDISTSVLKCNICDKQFQDKSNLLLHINTHSDKELVGLGSNSDQTEKKLEGDKNSTDNSTKEVTGDKINNALLSFPCEICGRVFKRKQHVNVHMKVHNEGIFKCEMCQRVFTKREQLYDHTRGSHFTDHVTCDVCKRVFTTKEQLEYHMSNFHKGNTKGAFACDTCARRFTQRTSLVVHVKTKHSKALEGTKNVRIWNVNQEVPKKKCGRPKKHSVENKIQDTVQREVIPRKKPGRKKNQPMKKGQTRATELKSASENSNSVETKKIKEYKAIIPRTKLWRKTKQPGENDVQDTELESTENDKASNVNQDTEIIPRKKSGRKRKYPEEHEMPDAELGSIVSDKASNDETKLLNEDSEIIPRKKPRGKKQLQQESEVQNVEPESIECENISNVDTNEVPEVISKKKPERKKTQPHVIEAQNLEPEATDSDKPSNDEAKIVHEETEIIPLLRKKQPEENEAENVELESMESEKLSNDEIKNINKDTEVTPRKKPGRKRKHSLEHVPDAELKSTINTKPSIDETNIVNEDTELIPRRKHGRKTKQLAKNECRNAKAIENGKAADEIPKINEEADIPRNKYVRKKKLPGELNINDVELDSTQNTANEKVNGNVGQPGKKCGRKRKQAVKNEIKSAKVKSTQNGNAMTDKTKIVVNEEPDIPTKKFGRKRKQREQDETQFSQIESTGNGKSTKEEMRNVNGQPDITKKKCGRKKEVELNERQETDLTVKVNAQRKILHGTTRQDCKTKKTVEVNNENNAAKETKVQSSIKTSLKGTKSEEFVGGQEAGTFKNDPSTPRTKDKGASKGQSISRTWCRICRGTFAQDKRLRNGRQWIQCPNTCKMWYHEDCVGVGVEEDGEDPNCFTCPICAAYENFSNILR